MCSRLVQVWSRSGTDDGQMSTRGLQSCHCSGIVFSVTLHHTFYLDLCGVCRPHLCTWFCRNLNIESISIDISDMDIFIGRLWVLSTVLKTDRKLRRKWKTFAKILKTQVSTFEVRIEDTTRYVSNSFKLRTGGDDEVCNEAQTRRKSLFIPQVSAGHWVGSDWCRSGRCAVTTSTYQHQLTMWIYSHGCQHVIVLYPCLLGWEGVVRFRKWQGCCVTLIGLHRELEVDQRLLRDRTIRCIKIGMRYQLDLYLSHLQP